MRSSRDDGFSLRDAVSNDIDKTADTGPEIEKPKTVKVLACPKHDSDRYRDLWIVGVILPFGGRYFVSNLQRWPDERVKRPTQDEQPDQD